jgi:hypothetical protein
MLLTAEVLLERRQDRKAYPMTSRPTLAWLPGPERNASRPAPYLQAQVLDADYER